MCPNPCHIKNTVTPIDVTVFWLGWRDSDPRDDGVKVRCLTAWLQPNIYFVIKYAHSMNYGRILYGVEGGIRTHGLQSHNLTR